MTYDLVIAKAEIEHRMRLAKQRRLARLLRRSRRKATAVARTA